MSVSSQTDISTLADICMSSEQRRHPRYICLDGGVVRLSIRPEFKGRRALLADISVGGIGFVTAEPLEEGTVLVFELRAPTGEATNRIARVRHSRPTPTPAGAPWIPQPPALSRLFRSILGMKKPAPEGHAWLIGSQFDQPLTEDELKQLIQSFDSETIELP